MSIQKDKQSKVFCSFRIKADVIEKIKEMAHREPLLFNSQARIIDSALDHFLSLSKTEQREIIKKYLTKDL